MDTPLMRRFLIQGNEAFLEWTVNQTVLFKESEDTGVQIVENPPIVVAAM